MRVCAATTIEQRLRHGHSATDRRRTQQRLGRRESSCGEVALHRLGCDEEAGRGSWAVDLDDDSASVAQPQSADAPHTRMKELSALDRSAQRAPAELGERGGDPRRRGVSKTALTTKGTKPPLLEVLRNDGGNVRHKSFGRSRGSREAQECGAGLMNNLLMTTPGQRSAIALGGPSAVSGAGGCVRCVAADAGASA